MVDKDAKIAWLRAEHLKLRRENHDLRFHLDKCRKDCAKVAEGYAANQDQDGTFAVAKQIEQDILALAPTEDALEHRNGAELPPDELEKLEEQLRVLASRRSDLLTHGSQIVLARDLPEWKAADAIRSCRSCNHGSRP